MFTPKEAGNNPTLFGSLGFTFNLIKESAFSQISSKSYPSIIGTTEHFSVTMENYKVSGSTLKAYVQVTIGVSTAILRPFTWP